MTVSDSSFFIESLTLPHEDPAEHRQFYNQWITAYPGSDPIERGFLHQAILAEIELRRVRRQRMTCRTEKVRTAVLFFDRIQEDITARYLRQLNDGSSALVGLLRSAAGCRRAIAFLERLETKLAEDGTWYGADRIGAIQLQGFSACIDDLCHSEEAYRTWLDCLVAQPNPKQADIDEILDRQYVPKSLQDRDVTLWPGDPVESRARLKAMLDRELLRLRALEAHLRVHYEEPARAEAEVMATADVGKEEQTLLRTERMYEQSYARAVAALMKVRKQNAATQVPPKTTVRELDQTLGILRWVAKRRSAISYQRSAIGQMTADG